MGFGKWILGGVCAVGAVVAAPVVLPAAGLAIAAAPVTGTIGLTAGLGMATASTGTVAAAAGAAAGAAGVAAGALQEKKQKDAYDRGKNDGMVSASEVYEEKCRKQEQDFKAQIKEYMEIINILKDRLNYYKEKENLTEEELREREQYEEEMIEYIKKLEEELSGEDSSTTALVSEYISDARNLISAVG